MGMNIAVQVVAVMGRATFFREFLFNEWKSPKHGATREDSIMAATKEQIVQTLRHAYNMEVETVLNYLANSLHIEGVRADFIKQALAADIQEELGHAQQLGHRIKQLGGAVPGSLHLKMTQKSLEPPEDSTDVVHVIKGVLQAEEDAINQYKSIIKLTDGEDYVTQDLAITLLSQEEAHRQQFEGYLKEYTRKHS
jgi:bacterioferritin